MRKCKIDLKMDGPLADHDPNAFTRRYRVTMCWRSESDPKGQCYYFWTRRKAEGFFDFFSSCLPHYWFQLRDDWTGHILACADRRAGLHDAVKSPRL
jgi:hypothetical protein